MTDRSWFRSFWKRSPPKDYVFKEAAQLRDYVIELMRQRYQFENLRLDPDNTARFSATINGEQSSITVENLFGYLKSAEEKGELAKASIDRFVRGLGQSGSGSAEQVIVIVRSSEFVAHARQNNVSPKSRQVVGDLVAIYSYDSPDAITSIPESDFPEMTISAIHDLAIKNLTKWLSKTQKDNSFSPILLFYVDENFALTASLILLDEFWSYIDSNVGSDVYFAVPRRDQLFILDAKQQDVVPAFRHLIDVTIKEGVHLVSSELYRRRNGAFEIVP